jgi:hypothetical protein
MACTSADRCARAVCAVGFANCNASSPDCETSFAAGGTCLPRLRGTTAFATDYVYGSATAIATDGSFFLSGYFRGTVDFDPTAAQDLHSAAGPGDIGAFITKLNADGSYAWTRSFSDPGVGLSGVAAAADGAVIAVGGFRNSIDLDPGAGVDVHQAGTVAVGPQGLIVKLAADGSLVWGRTFEGTTDRSYSSAIAAVVDASGAVYVAGVFQSTVDFDPSPGTALRTAPLVGNAMLVKLTPIGEFSWVQTQNDDACLTQLGSVAIATDGTVWTVGSAGIHPGCKGTLFPPEPGAQPLVAAYGPGGDARGVWMLSPAQSSAYAFGVAAGANGSVYIGGRASGLIDLDPGPGVAMRWAGPSPSGFLLKIAPDASLLWAEALPGVSVGKLASTADGGVLLGGYGPTAGYDRMAVVAKVGPDGTAGWTFAIGGPNGSADDVAARGSSFVVVGPNELTGDFDPGPGSVLLDGGIRFLSRFTF